MTPTPWQIATAAGAAGIVVVYFIGVKAGESRAHMGVETKVVETKRTQIKWYRDETWRVDSWARAYDQRDVSTEERTYDPFTGRLASLRLSVDKSLRTSTTVGAATVVAKSGGTEKTETTKLVMVRSVLPRWSLGGGVTRTWSGATGGYGEGGVRVIGNVWAVARVQRDDRTTGSVGVRVTW